MAAASSSRASAATPPAASAPMFQVTIPPDTVAAHTAEQFGQHPETKGQRPWKALRRKLDRISPDYAT